MWRRISSEAESDRSQESKANDSVWCEVWSLGEN